MANKKYDRFQPHKKYLRRNRNVGIGGVICASYIILTILFASLRGNNLSFWAWMILLPLPLLIAFIVTLVKYARLLGQFSKIKEGETYELISYRPKITFMTYSSAWGARIHFCYGITVYDYQTKTKYHYLLGEAFKLDKDGMEKVQAKLFKELHIQCYAGTTLIKTIEDDPHFLKIRARYDYE